MMQRLCTHPNVGAVLLVSLGCEGFNRRGLEESIAASGRPVRTLVIQETGGTRKTIARGAAWVEAALAELASGSRCRWRSTSSWWAPSAAAPTGRAASPRTRRWVAPSTCWSPRAPPASSRRRASSIGCERHMAARAATPALGREIVACVEKAARYYAHPRPRQLRARQRRRRPDHAGGEIAGRVREERRLPDRRTAQAGRSPARGRAVPARRRPRRRGPRFGFPNINDNAEIAELIACGSHIVLFSTGRGSVVGSAISPVVKVCANPETFRALRTTWTSTPDASSKGARRSTRSGARSTSSSLAAARGAPTKSEALGHQEFILTYKAFEPIGPACLPVAA